MSNHTDALALAKLMRMNLTQLQAQLTDLINLIAKTPATTPPTQYVCGICGLDRLGPQALTDHINNVHVE